MSATCHHTNDTTVGWMQVASIANLIASCHHTDMSEQAKYPSQTAERFQIRMPDGLRDRIRAAAERNGRSMNTEIISALELMYPARTELDQPTSGEINDDEFQKILDDVDRLRQRLLASAMRPAGGKAKTDE